MANTCYIGWDRNLFPWTVDCIKWDEEYSEIRVHISLNNSCEADYWTNLSDLGNATDYVLDAIQWSGQ